jgi:hypothetical protein
MSRIRGRVRRTAAAGLGVAAAVAVLATPAAADPEAAACCSKTTNNSQYSVLTYRHWTCDWGSTGSSSDGCTDLDPEKSKWLAPGEYSPVLQDWDVLRVDAGWCYKVQFIVPGKVWTLYFNRSGLGHRYVKIEDWGTAVVKAQRYGSCP